MKIVFMGTAQFAVPSFLLLAEKENIAAVITTADKPKGRGHKVEPSPVRIEAEKLGINVIAVEKMKDDLLLKQITNLSSDLIIVIDFGKLIPKEILNIPKLGAICLHPSLLPKYRGPSPIEYALLNGEKITGNTIFFIEEKFDTGKILLQQETFIEEDETSGDLRKRLAQEGAKLVLKAVELIESGENFEVKEQNNEKATYSKLIEKEEGRINWENTALQNYNQIRAFTPKPGAFTFYKGKKLKITKSVPISSPPLTGGGRGRVEPLPGEIIDIIKDKGFIVSCGGNVVNGHARSLLILEVQPESKNIMSAWNFVQGYRITKGDRLGE